MPALAAALLLLLISDPLQVRVSGTVEDTSGARVGGASVSVEGFPLRTRTDPDGTFTLDLPPRTDVRLIVSASGYNDRVVPVGPGAAPVRVVLEVRGISEVLTVTAAGHEKAGLVTPASVTSIDAAGIASAAPLALDDLLRSVPGFSLFRRSSSRVANPTTQGVTLRGMAASGASRTAVLIDGVPMTDPFGGWVQWSLVPLAAIDRVEVARGGASDLFGGDALGGAIALATARSGGRLFIDGGTHGTARVSGFGGRTFGRTGLRAGVERFTTDGYVIVAPESRGPIDTPASSRHSALYGGLDHAGGRTSLDVWGGYRSESRGNGTPFQVNATATRHAAGRVNGVVGQGSLAARVHGAATDYEQTFSAVLAGRSAERPTSAQDVASSTAGVSVDWLQPWRRAAVLVGAAARGIGADLVDQPLSTPAPAPPGTTDASQRTTSLLAQVSLPLSPRVTLAAGLRAERWTSHRAGEAGDTRTNAGPRASVAYQHTPALSFRGSLQSGYRFPTINELYRDFRVGNALTQANPDLGPEESLGVEGSALFRRGMVTARAAAFSTHLTGGIVNVTLQSGPSLILRQRQNAASIRARGIDLEADVRLGPVLALTISSAFVDSSFRSGAGLDGLRVPQVPRVQASAGAQATWPAVSLGFEWRFTSAQFDDDRNQFLLDSAGTVNARAAWRLRRGVELFGALENAFDEEQDVGRTPLRTIGMSRQARVGLRLLR